MKIVFLHGLKSSPNSFKRRLLEEHGYMVYAPALPADDWELSVLRAQEIIETVKPDVVIGSSRGGAVAIASRPSCDLILIAPAWKKYCPWGTVSATTQIIHSPDDEIQCGASAYFRRNAHRSRRNSSHERLRGC